MRARSCFAEIMRATCIALWTASSVTACVADATLRRVEFRATASGNSAARTSQTPTGWTVTLERALIGVGPFYFRNAAPAIGTGAETGRVVGQVLALPTIDALSDDMVDLRDTVEADPSSQRGVGFAVTEVALQGEVYLHEPASGELAEASRGRAIAWVTGVATRGDTELRFNGFFALERPVSGQEIAWQQARRIRRIPAEFVPRQGGLLRIRIDPTHWLDAVDFASLPERDGVREFASPAATTQLRAGIHNANGITFAFD